MTCPSTASTVPEIHCVPGVRFQGDFSKGGIGLSWPWNSSPIADRRSRPDRRFGRVAGYIVGNQVNSHWMWCNRGHVTMEEFADDYLQAVRLAHSAVRRHVDHPREGGAVAFTTLRARGARAEAQEEKLGVLSRGGYAGVGEDLRVCVTACRVRQLIKVAGSRGPSHFN